MQSTWSFQPPATDLHHPTSAVELAPEMISLQIIPEEGLGETEQDHQNVGEVPHFEFVPQAFEIISTSLSASQDPSGPCLYYTFDPALNQFSTISWPWFWNFNPKFKIECSCTKLFTIWIYVIHRHQECLSYYDSINFMWKFLSSYCIFTGHQLITYLFAAIAFNFNWSSI